MYAVKETCQEICGKNSCICTTHSLPQNCHLCKGSLFGREETSTCVFLWLVHWWSWIEGSWSFCHWLKTHLGSAQFHDILGQWMLTIRLPLSFAKDGNRGTNSAVYNLTSCNNIHIWACWEWPVAKQGNSETTYLSAQKCAGTAHFSLKQHCSKKMNTCQKYTWMNNYLCVYM